MRVLAISGSLRRGSHNTRLLRLAAGLVPPSAKLELFEGLKEVPPYDEDDDVGLGPEGARRLREAIDEADAILIATPEYNSSLPGQLKNALDWASRPFPDNVLRNKPVAVIGASTGVFGAVWAQAEARKVLAATGARVIDVELPVGGAEAAFVGDRLADDELHQRLAEILDELVIAVERRNESAAGEPIAA
jgi:chromate reductase, NAD(P)H dehydrogenase (quinone)